MKQQKKTGEEKGQHDQGENAVAPAAAPLQVGCRPGEVSDRVYVGEVSPDDQGAGAECGAFAEAGPRERSPGKRVADGVYSSLASISSWTFPCSAPETGQPFFAASAALAKSAWLMPGTLPATSRRIFVIL